MNGKRVSQSICEKLTLQVQDFKKKTNITPRLCVLLIGDNPASHIYVKHKALACEQVGIQSQILKFPATLPKDELKKNIEILNNDANTHAILIQLPLPKHLPADETLSWISPKKDADCLTPENIGLFWSSKPRIQPCTPKGIILLLEHYNILMRSQNAVVVGRSQIVGRPIAQLLLEKQATVTICHSKTKDLKLFTKQADIVVVACGKHHLLNYEYFKKNSCVIDVGIHRIHKNQSIHLEGDVCSDNLESVIAHLSPVPGGVGPMTIASLLINTFELTKMTCL